jgi:hypothetical protein
MMATVITLGQLNESEQEVARRVDEEVHRVGRMGRETFGLGSSVVVESISIPVQRRPSAQLLDYLSIHYGTMRLSAYYDSKSSDIKLIGDNQNDN